MKLHTYDQTSQPPIEYLPMKSAEAYELGQTLTISDGMAVAGTGKPSHICMGTATGVAGGTIPAIRVNPDMEFAAVLTAAGTALKLGDSVTIAANNKDVTATTTSGVFTITGFTTGEKAQGDQVLGRFL